ncbi:MAG: TetR/AcrR family transcriptional regulator [Coriobacteriia bacterium]|nr:TetR/AcrR family transcriptional regulator [Coriobacteriia bacterium]
MMARSTSPVPAPTARYFAEFVEGRRGEILDAALAVFGESGYDAGTMREIARRVGVTEPALYRHYNGKESILADIVATAGDRIIGEMRAALATVSGDNMIPMLRRLIAMRRESLAAPATGSGGVVTARRGADAQAGAATEPTMQAGVGAVISVLLHAAPHNAKVVALLQQHLAFPMVQIARGIIPRIDEQFGIVRTPEDLDGKVRVFMSLLMGYFTTSLVLQAPPNDDAIVDALLAIMQWRNDATGQPA